MNRTLVGLIAVLLLCRTATPATDVDPAPCAVGRRTPAAGLADAVALAERRDPRAEAHLLAVLPSTTESEQDETILWLGRVGTERSIAPLLDVLVARGYDEAVLGSLTRIDRGWRLRPESERAAARLTEVLLASAPARGKAESNAAFETCWSEAQRFRALVEIDRAGALPAMEARLSVAGPCVSSLAWVIEESRLPVPIEHLFRALASPALDDSGQYVIVNALDGLDARWRESAAAIRFGREQVAHLEGPDPQRRHRAIIVQQSLRTPEARPALLRALADPTLPPDGRSAAAHALRWQSPDPAVRDALLRCIEREPSGLGVACARSLGPGDDDAVPALLAMLANEALSEDTRSAYGDALMQILRPEPDEPPSGPRPPPAPQPAPVSPREAEVRVAFRQLKAGHDESSREIASDLLERMGEASGALSLERALDILLEGRGYRLLEQAQRRMEAADPYEVAALLMARVRTRPEGLPHVAGLLALSPAINAGELVELAESLERLRSSRRGAGDKMAHWEIDEALAGIADRLSADAPPAAEAFLRRLAHHPEARVRAHAACALYRAGRSD